MITTFLIKQSDEHIDINSSTTMRHHVKEFTREELESLDSKYLVLFLKSLARTNPTKKIHLKLYNFSEEERRSFQDLNQNLTIESYELKVYDDFEKTRQLLWANLAIEQLQKHDKVILMDVDILIRGDIQKIYSALDEHDVAVQTWKTCGILCDYDTSTHYESIYMSGKEISADAIKICSGVMGLKGSKALQIFKEVRNLIDSSDPDWLSGQLHLYSLYKFTFNR